MKSFAISAKEVIKKYANYIKIYYKTFGSVI